MAALYHCILEDGQFESQQAACENFAAVHGWLDLDPPGVPVAVGNVCHVYYYTQHGIYTTIAPDDPPGGGVGAGGEGTGGHGSDGASADGGADSGDSSAASSGYGQGAGRAGGPSVGMDGASSEWTMAGGAVHGAPLYPDGLPCPRSIVTKPAERRLLSDITGRRQVRGLARDYLATEQIEWPPITEAQALVFKLWWRETLNHGGAWFATDHWPSPQGGVVHRRFLGEPTWQYIHGGPDKRMWSVSAECEVGGRRA